MVGKICGGKKNLSLSCQALIRVLARNFDRGYPPLGPGKGEGVVFFFFF
jgi:hypothetical protein